MARIFELGESSDAQVLNGTICAIGVFDGVHLGHRHLIGKAIAEAQGSNTTSTIITFDIDPDELFAPDGLRKLQGNDDRIALLASLPADYVAVIPFDAQTAALEPEVFLDSFFGSNVPRKVFVGTDFRFGKHARGDVQLLKQWGADHGMEVEVVDLLEMDGAPVKSTRIRKLLDAGDAREARKLLGRD